MHSTPSRSRATFIRVSFVFVVALASSWVLAARADAQVCQQFEVGSQKWQQCVQDAASGGGDAGGSGGGGQDEGNEKDKAKKGGTDEGSGGGGGIKGPEGSACNEFNVGSKEWTDCIEGAATGGGLMPWIVIVPLGVMLVGMSVMFTMQSRGHARFEPFSSARMGSTAGGWLIFMGFILGAMGAGSLIAEARADGPGGGFALAAYPLLACGAISFVVGTVMMIKARSRRRIETSGLSGTAKVMRVSQTSTYINENPVLMFDLEVEAPGLAPYRTTAKVTVPMYMTQRVGPGTTLPVKVDPSRQNDVVVDWGAMSSMAAGEPAVTANPSGP